MISHTSKFFNFIKIFGPTGKKEFLHASIIAIILSLIYICRTTTLTFQSLEFGVDANGEIINVIQTYSQLLFIFAIILVFIFGLKYSLRSILCTSLILTTTNAICLFLYQIFASTSGMTLPLFSMLLINKMWALNIIFFWALINQTTNLKTALRTYPFIFVLSTI